MNSRTLANGILRAVFILAGIILLGYFLYLIRSVIAYVLIAAVVALIGRPVVLFLRRKLKFPNTAAVLVVMTLLLLVIGGIIALFIPLISEQGRNLSLLNIDDLQSDLNSLYLQIMDYIGASPESLNSVIANSELDKSILAGVEFGFIPNFLNSILGILSNLSLGLFSVLFISFFFLKDSRLFENSLLSFVPDQNESRVMKSIEKIKSLLSRYFVGLIGQILVLFIIYTIVLLLVGIKDAVVIAFLCALFNIIPYIGPLIGGIIMIVLTMTSNLGSDFSSVILPDVGWVLLGLTIGQLVDNFLSQPLIFSNSVKSHPLEIFLVIIIAGLLFGVTGMIVAIPGYTAIKVILKEFLAENKLVRRLTKDL
ncbi:Predicted PurR-regulated permease PerM [Robiginitalea myxolifaciens]|uniref:Predicted PurR-regulated permease PerM n=1 Tax=Robiginitalea myxolifaciens TaxID=400055 RepID=A0A1I6H2R8_9FLAO|nr:AI-2E family transporter [Robiginitalea myxolifaciens]SFR48617.1 Predicted PurR-regulated permease PerM [Robiginitalea myxolifaciens]